MRAAFKRVPSELMTVEQVAAYLQLHKLTIYKFIRSGDLPALRLGRSFRVRRADVDEFLEAHKVASPRRARAVRPEVGDRPARAAVRPQEAQRHPVSAADVAEPADLREERRRRREALIASNPLEWVTRGLH